jgi:predicted DNA-binding transcriptional regulator YafY
VGGVNRTERLYALVEQLRATAPRAVTSRQIAERFEVSVRTIERDLSALQQAGVPIWATPGPGGGYAIDPSMTLPPVNFTAHEALAVAVALSRAGTMPFARSARTALHKLVATMSADAAGEARELAERVRLFLPDGGGPRALAPVVEQAVLGGEVVAIEYEDRDGNTTSRAIEPAGFVGDADHWYLVAWCRLRGAGRSFRLDRIRRFEPTGEVAPARPFEAVSTDLPAVVRRTPLAE